MKRVVSSAGQALVGYLALLLFTSLLLIVGCGWRRPQNTLTRARSFSDGRGRVLLLHRNEPSGRRLGQGAAEGRAGEGLSVGQDEAFLSGEYDTGYLERLLNEES